MILQYIIRRNKGHPCFMFKANHLLRLLDYNFINLPFDNPYGNRYNSKTCKRNVNLRHSSHDCILATASKHTCKIIDYYLLSEYK